WSGKTSPSKRVKRSCRDADGALSPPVSGDSNNNSIPPSVTEVAGSPDPRRTVTCYQCSLCPYLSQTLPLLREHLKQHNEQHSDLILMCSECHFTSRDHRQLEAHVRLHFDNGGPDSLKKRDGEWTGYHCALGAEEIKTSADSLKELPQKKKWYSYEEYGLYRCLICSYVCSQQRMLKTHAWKHAGLVDCSYPIFEDEDEGFPKKDAGAAVNSSAGREEIVVLSPVLQEKNLQKLPAAFKLQLCVPVTVDDKPDALNLHVSDLSQSPKAAAEEEEEHAYPIKDLASEEPVVEVQVKTEAEAEVEAEGDDSLLSSAQKIINSSPNSAGHINVIVERLPSAEDSVMTTNPLLLTQEEDREEGLMGVKKDDAKEERASAESQMSGADVKSSKTSDSSSDENVPPAGRKRTHSESLRLHSLAAEALVAMPMRTTELPTTSSKASVKSITAQAQSQKMSEAGAPAAFLDLELPADDREEDLGPLGYVEGDEESPAVKAGISLSLLTVIERLRERSDQNASDEDILKELQDNAQFHNGAVAGVVAGAGGGAYVEGLVGPAESGLVDYIPGSERPYRCRLCRYSSGNKGYIKQHLRVHKQREPYQCPICEHIAADSKDLENHMIHHCKSRMYQCKQCPLAFHYKVNYDC
uniref:Zinc finger protein 507 n=1 Tax=Salarias fasciatus TaxID=181472 RepID=A0A672IAB0_SALFA